MIARLVDAARELRIRLAVVRLQRAIGGAESARHRLNRANAHLMGLVRARSPAQVARMERAAYARLSPAERSTFDRYQASVRVVGESLRAIASQQGAPMN